jgi:hypothetical protein
MLVVLNPLSEFFNLRCGKTHGDFIGVIWNVVGQHPSFWLPRDNLTGLLYVDQSQKSFDRRVDAEVVDRVKLLPFGFSKSCNIIYQNKGANRGQRTKRGKSYAKPGSISPPDLERMTIILSYRELSLMMSRLSVNGFLRSFGEVGHDR